jgi:hypothetical protein
MSVSHTFTQQEKHLLRGLAGSIISASEELKMPGADDETIFDELLERAERSSSFRRQMGDFFAEFGGVAAVTDLNDTDFKVLMEMVQKKQHPFLDRAMSMVAVIYYQNPDVLRALNKDVDPPFPRGHDLEQGDWSLLDPVKNRAPFFRKF